MNEALDRRGVDTWLARALLARGAVPQETLVGALARARQGRGQGPTLARVLLEGGFASQELLARELAALAPEGEVEGRWEPGAEVAGYRLLRVLGSGGMGTVWEAEREGARYALKTVQAGADAEARLRFRREAEAQARVDRHPHVASIHSCGVWGGQAYLVMDLLPGGDLLARLGDGPLAWRAALELTRDLAGGLAHVHAQGVLHRDLKPANVLFDERGAPCLVDFGLARIAEASSLTQTGAILGTPAYMAPEQVRGEAADARTDVYGLGALLYHCLTGRPPFEGTALEVLTRVLHEPPAPPRRRREEVPAAAEELCLRAMARRPQERFQTALELAAACEAALGGAAPPPGPRAPGWALGGVLGLALGALLGALVSSASAPGGAPSALGGAPSAREGSAPSPSASALGSAASEAPSPPLAGERLPDSLPRGLAPAGLRALAQRVAEGGRWRELPYAELEARKHLTPQLAEALLDAIGVRPADPPPAAAEELARAARELLVISRVADPGRDLGQLTRRLGGLLARPALVAAVLPSAGLGPRWEEQLRACVAGGAFDLQRSEPFLGDGVSEVQRVTVCEDLLLWCPRESRAWRYLALRRYEAGHLDVALPLMRRAVELAPEQGYPHYFVGRLLVELGQQRAGVEVLERARGLQSGMGGANTLCTFYLARGLFELGEPARAFEVLEATLEEAEDFKRSRWRADLAYRYWALRAQVAAALGKAQAAAAARERAAAVRSY
ncbi:MAG: protein kinase [Planctomycetota bacterium]